MIYTGWSSRRAFCVAGHADGRSAALLADAKAPTSRIIQADPDSAGAAGAGYFAVGGQLRASIRLHIRLLSGLRADAIYFVRPLRSQTKNTANLDLPGPDRGLVHPAACSLLQRASIRV